MGLNGIGIEVDEHYLKEAVARTRAAVSAKDRRRAPRQPAV
jgi:hypothetical protein